MWTRLLPVALLLAAGCAREAPADDLRDRVEAALRANPDVDPREVDVVADGSTIVLSGEVETLLAEQEALRTARETPGVGSVADRIDLEPYRRPDAVIERRVAQALMTDPGTSLNVDVVVVGGVAYLRGDVEALAHVEQARRIAASVRGVTRVVDDLRLGPVAAR